MNWILVVEAILAAGAIILDILTSGDNHDGR